MANQISMDMFKPRDYQKKLIKAVLIDNFKNVMAIWPRRAGKDLTTWNIIIDIAMHKVCIVYYILPTYSQAKKTIWQAISSDGMRFMDYIPAEIIASINSSEMKITLKNNSIIQLIGGDSYNTSLVGSNPYICVFSEFSVMESAKEAYEYASPILAANNGICIFLFTPRGRNYAYHLYQAALEWKDWFVYKLTLDDTKHISDEVIAREREKYSQEFIAQEYYTDFSRGIEGSVYGRYVDKLRQNERITTVDWDPTVKVNSSWDLGRNKNMSVILFQVKGQEIRIIDYIQLKDGALPEYIAELKKKPYIYGVHIAPHDIQVHDIGTNITRWGIAASLGIIFTQAPGKSEGVGLLDGIEATKAIFHRLWIDEKKCDHLVKALENYQYVYDEKKEEYSKEPISNWSSHPADSLRYLAISMDKLNDGLSAKELDERFATFKGGGNPISNVFQQPFDHNGSRYL